MSSEANHVTIEIDPYTDNPTKAWDRLKSSQFVQKLNPLDPNQPVSPNHVRFVCLSDTHSVIHRMSNKIPPGDVLIHAGDFTRYGDVNEVKNFNSFIGTLPHPHKIVIAGNHELSFDPKTVSQVSRFPRSLSASSPASPPPFNTDPKSLLTNCTYLEDSGTEVYGLKIYGSPWQPEFCGWAFNLRRGYPCLEKWNLIPSDTDVLVTHGPPIGHGDSCASGVRAGCVELLNTIQQRVKPKYHVFGHIHEGHGITTDMTTVYVNASICTIRYQPLNPPIVFDIPLPPGQTK